MPVLHLENVPDDLYQRLEQLARQRQQPLTSEALNLLADALARAEAEEQARVQAMLEEVRRTRYPLAPGTPDSVELLREDPGTMTPAVQYVIDASVAVKVFLPEPLSAEATALVALLGNPATVFHVPDLFFVECANIFWKQVQRGNATSTQVLKDMSVLLTWRLHNTSTSDLAGGALAIALAHGITAYDACYVALAAQEGVPLITADQRLEQKLTGTGHAVVWLGAWKPPAPPSGVP